MSNAAQSSPRVRVAVRAFHLPNPKGFITSLAVYAGLGRDSLRRYKDQVAVNAPMAKKTIDAMTTKAVAILNPTAALCDSNLQRAKDKFVQYDSAWPKIAATAPNINHFTAGSRAVTTGSYSPFPIS